MHPFARRGLLGGSLRRILGVGFAGLAACGHASSPDAAEPPRGGGGSPESSVVNVELRTSTPRVKVGEAPAFEVSLVNRGSQDVTLVLPGDGSDCGWRTPILKWSPAGGAGMRCGNVNALGAREIVTLKPGESVAVTEWLGQPGLSKPGSYRVSLEYSNVPDLPWTGLPLGEHDPLAMERVRRSTRITAVSNAVDVLVEE